MDGALLFCDGPDSVREGLRRILGALGIGLLGLLHPLFPLGQALEDLNGIVDGGDGTGGAVLTDLLQFVDRTLSGHKTRPPLPFFCFH